MTYATKQLTEALQELTEQSVQFESRPHETTVPPEPVALEELQLSPEVDRFIEEKQTYSARTRSVSVGTY